MNRPVPTRQHACVVCGSDDSHVIARGTDYQYNTTDQVFEWQSCNICTHCFINPIPTEAALGTIYPQTLKNYADFDMRPSFAFRVKAWLDGRRLRSLAESVQGEGRLLDVGCAAGMLLDVARAYCPSLTTLHGLEISEAAALAARGKGYLVHISTIENAELPEDFYDLIVMQQVIEHVHDPRAVVAKLRKSLRAGGRLVMDTPNLGSWDQMLFDNGHWEGYHIPRHFNLWTIDGMRRMLSEAGFSEFSFSKRIKPVHWTLSFQNWAIATRKPAWVIRFFDLRNPLLLVVFGVIDVLQLVMLGKSSDIQYVAKK